MGEEKRWSSQTYNVNIQSLSHVQIFATPWNAAHRASLSFTISWRLIKFMSIDLVMLSNYLILCHPLLLLPSIFPSINLSQHQSFPFIFQWISSSHQMAKVLEPQLQHQSSNEYSGMISFRIDRFGLLALKSLLQHHNSKASILRSSAFFMVQLSHPYMTTGKTISLTISTFVNKVMSLLLLSRFVIAFYQGASLLLSWLQSPSAVILEPNKIKSVTASTFFPSICH